MDFVLLRGDRGLKAWGMTRVLRTYTARTSCQQVTYKLEFTEHTPLPVSLSFYCVSYSKCSMVWKIAESVRVFPFEGREGKRILTYWLFLAFIGICVFLYLVSVMSLFSFEIRKHVCVCVSWCSAFR